MEAEKDQSRSGEAYFELGGKVAEITQTDGDVTRPNDQHTIFDDGFRGMLPIRELGIIKGFGETAAILLRGNRSKRHSQQ